MHKEDIIKLGHGGGGRKGWQLINHFVKCFNNEILSELHDGAKLQMAGGQLAFSTDSYVVNPLFFPGGNIGKLAVCGTVNDLAVTGAEPSYLSAGFIIEEGFPMIKLEEIVHSMCAAAQEAGVWIVTGDTKVVERGAAQGIYINTAGIGTIWPEVNISSKRIKPGQKIIVSGSLGDHALAIMSQRYELSLPSSVKSDCAPLNQLVKEILTCCPQVPFLRDLTRGGLAGILNEIANQANLGILIEEHQLPIKSEVTSFCDILGFDPLYLANEGKLLVVVDEEQAGEVLAAMLRNKYGKEAHIIGEVIAGNQGKVGLRTLLGGIRVIEHLSDELLPRIC